MPVTYYTKEEFDIEINKLKARNMALCHIICKEHNHRCVIDSEWSTLLSYCSNCPVEYLCKYDKKRFPK